MVLVPEVVDAVAPIPVLAAGGIARGRQLAAALALGAEGVWCGSVWLTTEEAETDPVVKEKFLTASVGRHGAVAVAHRQAGPDAAHGVDRRVDRRRTRRPRCPMPLQSALVADAQLRIHRSAHQGGGAQQLDTYFVGQVVGALDRVKPARQVLLDMVEEYIDAFERLRSLTDG